MVPRAGRRLRDQSRVRRPRALLQRASFLRKALWVTAYRPHERFPGGDFPNQRPPSKPDGLAHWVQRDARLEGEDLVLWHSRRHPLRASRGHACDAVREGWRPRCKPVGFFDASPCLDVPCAACGGGGAGAALRGPAAQPTIKPVRARCIRRWAVSAGHDSITTVNNSQLLGH